MAQRLAELPDHDWPSPLDVQPLALSSDVVIEGTYAILSDDPTLTAFEAAQIAAADAAGRPDLAVNDFGPEVFTHGFIPAWGRRALPALVSGAIDDDPVLSNIFDVGMTAGDPEALLEAAAQSGDSVAYAEVVRQVSVSPSLSPATAGRAWEFLRQTTGRGGRYTAQGELRTVDDMPPVPIATVLADMAHSEVSRTRRNALVGAERFGLLDTSAIDDALADSDFLVRLDAARHFWNGSDVSEARQVQYLALLDDPAFVERVRLDVIRSMGFSELSEDLFSDSPSGLFESIQVYRGAVVGDMLLTAPADVSLEPVASLAPAFFDVDPVAEDLVDALRRNTVHTPAQKVSFVSPLVSTELENLGCTFIFEQMLGAESTPGMAESARGCFIQLENHSDPNVQATFVEDFADLEGSASQRHAAMLRLYDTPGWHGRRFLAAALLRTGVFEPDEAWDAAREYAGFTPEEVLPAYVDGGGTAAGLVAMLDELAGYPEGGSQPDVRMGSLYHVAPRLLLEAGVEGDELARVVTDMLATEPGHAFPLWRVFVVSTAGYRSDHPIDALMRLLAHPSVSDEAMLAGLARIAAPEGVVDRQVVRYLRRAGVDPNFIARVMTAHEAAQPLAHATTLFEHVVPAQQAPDVEADLVQMRVEAMSSHAQGFVDEVPMPAEVDAWLGPDRLSWEIPTAAEALPVVLQRAGDGISDPRPALEALRDLTYAQDIDTLSPTDVETVRAALTQGEWANLAGMNRYQRQFGLMLIDCQRGANYDELRGRYRDTLGLRWDLADAARSESESAALNKLLTHVGRDYGTSDSMLYLAEICAVGGPLASDVKHALASEGLARHLDINGTYNGDLVEALLVHDSYDLSAFQPAMLRRAGVMASWFDGIDPLFARWVSHPGVPTAHALELVTLTATMTKRGEPIRADFPSLVRAFVERGDVSPDQRLRALALVAAVR